MVQPLDVARADDRFLVRDLVQVWFGNSSPDDEERVICHRCGIVAERQRMTKTASGFWCGGVFACVYRAEKNGRRWSDDEDDLEF
jgi:hypothetical protein